MRQRRERPVRESDHARPRGRVVWDDWYLTTDDGLEHDYFWTRELLGYLSDDDQRRRIARQLHDQSRTGLELDW